MLIEEENYFISGEKLFEVNFTVDETEAVHIKIVVWNFRTIPEGKQGAGHQSWLFIDEITIE